MKAVILSGGLGSRLGNLTKNCPKPLLKIRHLSIIEWQILCLKKAGVTEVLINLHYLGNQIQECLGNGTQFGIKIKYIYQDILNGTAGGVKIFQNELISEKYFFVLYGDILINETLSDLILHHNNNNADCSIYVHERKEFNSLLFFKKSNGMVLDFIERPNLKEKKCFINKYKINKYYSNSSIYLMNSNILDYIPENKDTDFPKHIFSKIIKNKKLYALQIKKQRYAIDTEETYKLAQKFFKP